jgi:hypothetical protein
MHHFAFHSLNSESHKFFFSIQRSTHFKIGPMSSFKFNSQMQAFVQTQKMDQLEQEIHELREEVTTLRAEVEKLTNLVSSLMVTQVQPLCPQQPRQQALQQFTPQNQAKGAPKFDPIPVKYAELFPTLLKEDLIQTRPPPPVPKRLPMGYRADLSCAFHQGAPGHDIERCFAFKTVVQRLIQDNTLSPEGQLLVQPQPQQQAPRALQFDLIPMKYAELLSYLLKKSFVQTKAPLPVPKKLPAWWRPDLFCVFHQGAQGHDVEPCFSLKIEVQKLIDDNVLPFKNLNPSV